MLYTFRLTINVPAVLRAIENTAKALGIALVFFGIVFALGVMEFAML